MKVHFAAALMISSAIASETECPRVVQIEKTLETFSHQKFANEYHGSNGAVLKQNPADDSWFVIRQNKNPIISFDGENCPTNNKKWYELDMATMQYKQLEDFSLTSL